MSPTRVRSAVVIAGVLVAGLVGMAQQRSTSAAATGEISGVLMGGGASASPIRRAIVSIASDVLPYARSAITDDAGRFAFTALPAGSYAISAKKAAYLAAEFGSANPGRPGSRLALAGGERRAVTLTMWRGAAIAGVLRTPAGTPMAGVSVSAVSVRALRSQARMGPDSTGTATNDRGEYRIYGLAPGEYAVVALPAVGGEGEIGARSAAETDALLAALAQSRNPTKPASTSAPLNVLQPAARVVGYSPIFFPGTPWVKDAETIRLAAGDERDRIGFTVSRVPVASIEGTITGDVPSLAGVQIAIIPEVQRLSLRGQMPFTAVPPNNLGEFKYGNLSPGRYQIVARARRTSGGEPPVPPAPANPTGGARIGAPPPPGVTLGTGELMYAVADVEIRGQDVKGVSLALESGGVITGTVAFNSGGTPEPANPAAIRLGVSMVGEPYAYQVTGIRVGNILSDVPLSPVGTDSTFRIVGLGPSRYTLTVTLPADLDKIWKLRTAMVAGRDLLDEELYGLTTRLSGVTLTFSDKRTELAGTLLSESGQPANAYHVIAFSADRAHWRYGSRRTLSARPATDGRFVFSDLPAGEYLVAALTDLDPDQWQEPAFLEQVAPVAIKITIAEGETKRQDLKIR